MTGTFHTEALPHRGGLAAVIGAWLVHWLRMAIGFGIYSVGSVLLIVSLPAAFLLCGCRRRRLQTYVRYVCHYFFQVCFWYVRMLRAIDVRMVRHTDAPLAPIVVCNHISMFDVMTVLAFVPDINTFVKAKFQRVPIVGPLLWAQGYILLDVNDPDSRIKAYLKAKEVLESGGRIVVFPEGTRTRTGQLGEFQNGVFKLALDTGCAISPVVFTSTRPVFANVPKSLVKNLSLVTYRMHVMPQVKAPLTTETAGRTAVSQFRKQVHGRFVEWLSAPWVPEWQRTIKGRV